MKTAQIYWDLITSVDHAILLPNGQFIGNSFDLGATISGGVDADEQVVIDFSTGKKKIKAIIDGDIGLDHKLWVPMDSLTTQDKDLVSIRTPSFEATLPRDAIYVYEPPTAAAFHFIEVTVLAVLDKFRSVIERELSGIYGQSITVDSLFVSRAVPNVTVLEGQGYTVRTFRYVHGLPRSTSYGCQNPLHGHLSYLALRLTDAIQDEALDVLFEDLNSPLMDGYIYSDYTTVPSFHFFNEATYDVGENTISYDTLNRGKHALTLDNLPDDIDMLEPLSTARHIEVSDYSTVENLSSFFGNKIVKVLKDMEYSGTVELITSEGLNKGAIFRTSL